MATARRAIAKRAESFAFPKPDRSLASADGALAVHFPICTGRIVTFVVTISESVMITKDQTHVRTCIRTGDRNQQVTMCQFVSMLAKARRARRKQRQFEALRRSRQWRERPESYKKTQSQSFSGFRDRSGANPAIGPRCPSRCPDGAMESIGPSEGSDPGSSPGQDTATLGPDGQAAACKAAEVGSTPTGVSSSRRLHLAVAPITLFLRQQRVPCGVESHLVTWLCHEYLSSSRFDHLGRFVVNGSLRQIRRTV